jgi:hypothetical protein
MFTFGELLMAGVALCQHRLIVLPRRHEVFRLGGAIKLGA